MYPELQEDILEDGETAGLPVWPLETSTDQDISMTLEAADMNKEGIPDSPSLTQKTSDKKSKKSKHAIDGEEDQASKSNKHSSKNEGQHTNKRYLCYHCNKLFTRRRSVRDHIAKIHSVKSWEPLRSLEIIVDPATGEPEEPLEDIIARGPPPAPEKPAKSSKHKEMGEPDESMISNEQLANVESPRIEAGDEAPEPEIPILPDSPPAPEVKQEEPPPVLPRPASPARAASPIPTPTSIIGKKRPAEALKPLPAAITKKGIARPKPTHIPNKKPKLSESDSVSEKATPIRSPSATPAASSRAPPSKLKKQALSRQERSPTPVSSRFASIDPVSPSPSAAETPGSSNDDGEVFCLCRKGDNHSWMIACDGGCDDWFHGKCVDIRERDGDLIDKYICPNCSRNTGMQTTWKRMCRRKDCRKPARVFQEPPSKYCSKECGRMFFVELLRRGDPYIDTIKNDQYVIDTSRPKKMRKKGKLAEKQQKSTSLKKALPLLNGDLDELGNSDSRLATPAMSDEERSEYETDSSADEDMLPNRGGALRAGEVKAILDVCSTIDQWRELGRKPDTPPREPDEKTIALKFDDFEKRKLEEISAEKTELEKRETTLDAREKMLNLIKTRSSGITEEIKKAAPKDKKGSSKKDPCGFDPRLAWSEEQFIEWHVNSNGKNMLDSNRIGPPEDTPASNPMDNSAGKADTKMTNGVPDKSRSAETSDDDGDDDSEETEMPKKGGVCVRNRCPRHRNWAKGCLAEIRFEQDLVRRRVRRCEEAEREIRERATVRAWEGR